MRGIPPSMYQLLSSEAKMKNLTKTMIILLAIFSAFQVKAAEQDARHKSTATAKPQIADMIPILVEAEKSRTCSLYDMHGFIRDRGPCEELKKIPEEEGYEVLECGKSHVLKLTGHQIHAVCPEIPIYYIYSEKVMYDGKPYITKTYNGLSKVCYLRYYKAADGKFEGNKYVPCNEIESRLVEDIDYPGWYHSNITR